MFRFVLLLPLHINTLAQHRPSLACLHLRVAERLEETRPRLHFVEERFRLQALVLLVLVASCFSKPPLTAWKTHAWETYSRSFFDHHRVAPCELVPSGFFLIGSEPLGQDTHKRIGLHQLVLLDTLRLAGLVQLHPQDSTGQSGHHGKASTRGRRQRE